MVKRKNIAFVLRTIGLEYDDRVRKEATALSKIAKVTIYVNFADNRKESGITNYGIPYKSFTLKTREKLPSSKYLFIKAIDFFLQVRPYLNNSDIVWSHEEYAFMFPLLLNKNKSVWDLHEIPFRFEKGLMKKVFQFIEYNSLFLIHANKFRIEYLKKQGVISNLDKHFHIHNYPDGKFLNSDKVSAKFMEFKKWVGSDKYVYLQGLTVKERFPTNSIKSILDITDYKIVVIGPFDKTSKDKLSEEFSIELDTRVFFVGLEDQVVIPSYLKNAEFTVVLYDSKKPNNLYCEPNRLYQAISLNVPVIVGNNPPMKEVVMENNFGIVIEDDGNDLLKLNEAVSKMLDNKYFFDKNLKSKSKYFRWDDKHVLKII
ncbi:glycosyltransferase [Flavobacteriales bacterium]|nr:glycosyltransferase [Flavobacteriales bacterium]